MKEDDFYRWLYQEGYNNHTASSRISNCKRVENIEGDLDVHYDDDRGRALLARLAYSKDDEAHNLSPKHGIQINGNKFNGTATFRAAVNLYFKFKSGLSKPLSLNPQHSDPAKPKKKDHKWPDWEKPTDEELQTIISISTRYVKFLNPDIIWKITEENDSHREEWRKILKSNGIDPNVYLWEKSPCAFPGVRRYAGSSEIALFHKKGELFPTKLPGAIILDDNDFPKQIWSFTFRGKNFQKAGPDEYSLAHLADHKVYKNRAMEEFLIENNSLEHELYGLYTCPTNTVFLPKNFIRLTDFSSKIRRMLIYKANDLYGKHCQLFPSWVKLIPEPDDVWHQKSFKWSEPVGTMDNIEDFINYRNEIMGKLLQEAK